MTQLVYSADAWRLLQGVVSIYKPPGMAPKSAMFMLKSKLVHELNKMERKVDPRFLAGKSNYLQIDPSKQGGQYISQSQLVENQLKVPATLRSYNLLAQQKENDLSISEIAEEDHIKEDYSPNIYNDDEAGNNPDSFQEDCQNIVDYSSHPLVLGPGYEETDFVIRSSNILTTRESGVFVLCLNKSVGMAKQLKRLKLLKTYEIDCEFGKHTRTNFSDGKVIAKATWKHLINRRSHLDTICSNIEASHRRQAWVTARVDPQSQEGFELACKGPIRPHMMSDTIIYSIRCTSWNLPNFTLKIQCVGENHEFLLETIAEIGIRLKTHAHASKLRCSQVGCFAAEDSLVTEELSLEKVLHNISANRKIMNANDSLYRSNFQSVDLSNNNAPKMLPTL